MKILNDEEIKQKIVRLAYEILENNYDQKEIFFAGINNNGVHFAHKIIDTLHTLNPPFDTQLFQVKLNPANPIKEDITIEIEKSLLQNKNIILVDDVANTGRTLFFAFKPLLEVLPKKVEVAVLVDRKHKMFPVKVDYMGISLATTLKENIDVQLKSVNTMAVYLT